MPRDLTMAETIAARGGNHPDRRADLDDLIWAATARLVNAAEEVRDTLSNRLEAHAEHCGDEIESYRDLPVAAAIAGFDEARVEVVNFLIREGGHKLRLPETSDVHVCWVHMGEINEESLADALSAYLEGTATRQHLDEVRRCVLDRRARFEESITDAVVAMGEAVEEVDDDA